MKKENTRVNNVSIGSLSIACICFLLAGFGSDANVIHMGGAMALSSIGFLLLFVALITYLNQVL